MSDERTMLMALIGICLAVYSLLALIPLVMGFGILLPGGDIAFPLLIMWCVLNWRSIAR